MTYRILLVSIALSLASCTAIVNGREQVPDCLSDDDCETLDICAGPNACDPMTHTCVTQNMPKNCDDDEPCTADSCDSTVSGGCVNTLNDADHDTYAPQTCTSATYQGGDCNDNNSAVHPLAAEQCGNGIDDNCNGTTDSDAPASMRCYRDADGDGFHDASLFMDVGCSCPTGYITPNPMGPDCADGVADAHPGVTAYFTHQYCTNGTTTQDAILTSGSTYVCPSGFYASYDYNCQAGDEPYLTAVKTSCQIGWIIGAAVAGINKATFINPTLVANPCFVRWDTSTGAPGCGGTGNQWQCASYSTCNSAYTSNVPQQCH